MSGSYYEGAIVCFDTNNDGSCDGESSRTTSDSHGDFTLTGNSNYPIIAEIPEGAKKHEVIGDTGVAIDGNTIVVGAYLEDTDRIYTGAAYVYEKNKKLNLWLD